MNRPHLERAVASWLQAPDDAAIRATLRDDPERQYLATVYAAARPEEVSEDIAELVTSILDADALMDRAVDTLIGVATGGSADPGWAADLAERIEARPDGDAFQTLLVDNLAELARGEDVPDAVLAGLVDAAGELALHLEAPAMIELHLAYLAEHDDVPAADRIRRCLGSLNGLPAELRTSVAVDLICLLDAEDDPDLVVPLASVALADPPPDLDIDDRRGILAMHACALATTDQDAAANRVAEALERDPRLLDQDLTDAWFQWRLAGLARLGLAEVPPRSLFGEAASFLSHRDWWPNDDEQVAMASLVLARLYLAGNEPDEARPHVEAAARLAVAPEVDPAVLAEAANLRLQLAHQTGEHDRLPALLRETADVLRRSSDAEHREAWLAFAESLASAGLDPDLVDSIQAVADAGRKPHDPDVDFCRDLLSVQKRLAAGIFTCAELDEVEALLARADDSLAPHLRIGAQLIAAALLTALRQFDRAEEFLASTRNLLDREATNGVGGHSLVSESFMYDLMHLQLRVTREGLTPGVIRAVEEMRRESDRQGLGVQSHLLTRMLLHLHFERREDADVQREGVRLLADYRLQSIATPAARERKSLYDELSTTVDILVQSASRRDDRRGMAELLEIVRAQPVPIVHDDVPVNEQSFQRILGTFLTVEDGEDWSGAWSAERATHAKAGGPTYDEDPGATLLVGVPPIAFPWGRAFEDRLTDPGATVTARVVVPVADLM